MSLAPPATACPPDDIDLRAHVRQVIDGDTVLLSDGRPVRFIGIDTPEIGRDGRADQPYAQAARETLKQLVDAADGQLWLSFGEERRDKYRRLLAHVYTPAGDNLTEVLLEQGLGTSLTVPPNLGHLDCYRRAEQAAQGKALGIWSLARYQIQEAAAVPAGFTGYARVRGSVQRIGRGGGAVWLQLAPGFAVRIPEQALRHFAASPPATLAGRTVIVSGWVQRRNGESRLTVRHPAALHLEP